MKRYSTQTKILATLALLMLSGCAAQESGTEIRLAPGSQPTDLTCPRTSNCVNSISDSGLASLRYTGNADQGMALLRTTLASYPEATIARSDPIWLEVIFTTFLGFRDQVDFVLDAKSGAINYRSRSLVGRYDFGKNRARMTAFSELFATRAAQLPATPGN